MNIRDSYIHGADSRGVVKSLYFATSAESVSKADFSANYTTAAGKDLIFLLADTLGTKIGLPIPTLNQNTTGYASSLLTVKSTSTSNHYLTFVDSNNTTAEAESFYTSGDIYFKPSTGVLTVKSVTVNNTFNYAGIGSDTTSNAARKIWFASSSDGTPVVSDNFKYNPSTKTLTVDKISGPTIVIGNTTLYLDGANNVLTPDTVISNTSTNNTIPSSKAVWDAILAGIQANDAMVFKGFLTGGADVAHTAYTPGADRGDTYKVQTAGYINGEYYLVNDTFICTTDGTVAATSSTSAADMTTIKGNWGVVEGNGDYLSYKGGTMYGTLSWDGTTALPTVTTASSILVVDSNTTKQISLADLRNIIDLKVYVASAASGTNGKKQITAAQTDPYYNVIYGDTIIRSIQFKHGDNMSISSTTAGVITFTATNTWRSVYVSGSLKATTATNTKAMNFASSNLNISYLAAGTNSGQSGNANYFTINLDAKNWTGATSSANGTAGYMPGATSANRLKYLRGDGSWIALAPSISAGTEDTNKVKITVGGENSSEYTIPFATTSLTADTAKYLNTNNVNSSFKHLEINPSTRSYNYIVILLVAVQRAANSSAQNYLNGRFFMYKTGGNVYDVVDINVNQVYNTLEYNLTHYGQNSQFVLCRCLYNGIEYYALKCPYHANPYTNMIFTGYCRSDWDTNKLVLPKAIVYKNDESGVNIINSEINNSLTTTLTNSVVTYAINRPVRFPGGIIGDLTGNASTATTADNSDKLDGYHHSAFVKVATELDKVTKTLKVDTWTSMTDISSLDAGTYAIQIKSGTVYASGVFTACHGTDTVIDEIPLHVSNSSTNTWRPYARVSGADLLMTTNETTGTSRQYTINIIKLI